MVTSTALWARRVFTTSSYKQLIATITKIRIIKAHTYANQSVTKLSTATKYANLAI